MVLPVYRRVHINRARKLIIPNHLKTVLGRKVPRKGLNFIVDWMLPLSCCSEDHRDVVVEVGMVVRKARLWCSRSYIPYNSDENDYDDGHPGAAN